MGDNNIFKGTVARREGDRLVIDDGTVRASVVAPDDDRAWATRSSPSGPPL